MRAPPKLYIVVSSKAGNGFEVYTSKRTADGERAHLNQHEYGGVKDWRVITYEPAT